MLARRWRSNAAMLRPCRCDAPTRIDDQIDAGDRRRPIGRKELDRLGDFVRPHHATQRREFRGISGVAAGLDALLHPRHQVDLAIRR